MNLLTNLGYIKYEVFNQLAKNPTNLPLIADLIRFNTLLSVARAGTGHLGASLSIVELLTEIYFRSFKFDPKTKEPKNRDIFILSKGHAAPALYAVLAAKGYFETEMLNKLRRLGGLAGHCDIETPGIQANTGSLAIGLSKAVGFALAKKRFKQGGNVIVIVGDGELQEGQCWEAFLSAGSNRLDNLFIIIDDNKVQTDQLTSNIVFYGDLISAWKNMGFEIIEGDGRKISKIRQIFSELKKKKGRPKIFYSHSLKGQGISFMEHTRILRKTSDKYIWHNKSPHKDQLELAFNEIFSRIKKPLQRLGFSWDLNQSFKNIPIEPIEQGIKGDSLTAGFAKGLLDSAGIYENIVVFDADLEEDCGFIPFHQKYPQRFFEMGIMEQNMVSVAVSFSRLGYLPVLSTYAAFLTSRANEQLYNLASENAKALIVGNMSGVIPATPGKSHQAFRDIACMKNIPGIVMYQPVSGLDVQNIISRFFRGALGNILYLRLSMSRSAIELPAPPVFLKKGFPHKIRPGKNALAIGIGPVVLGEILLATDELSKRGIQVEVWNYPWLVDFDKDDLKKASLRGLPLLIIEDHFVKGGMAESLLSFLNLNKIEFKLIKVISLNSFPETGFRSEFLRKIGMDSANIISSVIDLLK